MLPKPRKPNGGCSLCPLEFKGIGYGEDRIGTKPISQCTEEDFKRVQLIILGEALGKVEVQKRLCFQGPAAFVLENWGIKTSAELQILYEQGKIYFGNTLRCLPPDTHGRHYPVGEERNKAERHCRVYDRWMESNSTTLLLGETPQRYWFRQELADEDAKDRRAGREAKGVLGRVGRVYVKEGKKFVFGLHPAAVLRQPELVRHLQVSLSVALAESRSQMVRRFPVSVERNYRCLEQFYNDKSL